MQWLELHNVEYGECIVLGGAHHDILMVDCGSINQKIREGNLDFSDYVDPTLMERYSACSGRAFLLTHYHRDHLCGLYQMLAKRGGYFDRILLPVSPAYTWEAFAAGFCVVCLCVFATAKRLCASQFECAPHF